MVSLPPHSGGSVNPAREPYHVADSNIRLEGANLICFAVPRVYFCWRGPQSVAKLDGGHGRICLLDPNLPTHTTVMFKLEARFGLW